MTHSNSSAKESIPVVMATSMSQVPHSSAKTGEGFLSHMECTRRRLGCSGSLGVIMTEERKAGKD